MLRLERPYRGAQNKLATQVFCVALLTANTDALGIQFEDVTTSAGIDYIGSSYGVSWGDVNADDWPDIWVGNHSHVPSLYVNNKDGTFSDEVYRVEYRPSDMHGAAWADFDNDGDQDLLTMSGAGFGFGQVPNMFFVNVDGSLQERGRAYGLDYPLGRGRTPLWFDWNRDGKLDVLLTNTARPDGKSPTALFSHTDGGFVDSISQTWLPPVGSRFGQLITLGNDYAGASLLIYQNPYPGAFLDYGSSPFVDLSQLIPLTNNSKWGVNDVAIADFNGDLLSDIFLARIENASEAFQTDINRISAQLNLTGTEKGFTFRADGTVQFEIESIKYSDVYIGGSGIQSDGHIFLLASTDASTTGVLAHEPGVDFGVYIGYDPSSGLWELLVSNDHFSTAGIIVTAGSPITDLATIGFENADGAMTDQLLFQSDSGFMNYSITPETGEPSACASVVAADFDNDMDIDLYLACHSPATNYPNILYENLGNGSFQLVPGAGGATGSVAGRGESVAVADYDRDGFMDIFLTNGFADIPFNQGPSQLFHNVGGPNHWLEIDLDGLASNRDGIGARVFATAGGVTQVRDQDGGMHRFSQNHKRVHFGLAGNTIVDSVEVLWPRGQRQIFTDVGVDQILQISEGIPVQHTGKVAYQAGVDYGYFVWQDEDDGEWHLRWSGNGVQTNTFSGTIAATGNIATVRAFSFEGNDSITPIDSTSLNFSARAGASEDGIDFFLPDGGAATFDLFIDGVPATGLVKIGAMGVAPQAVRLTLISDPTTGAPQNMASAQPYTSRQDAGYVLWEDADDGEWHLRWRGSSTKTFMYEGVIVSDKPISNVRAFKFEHSDELVIEPTGLRFKAFAGPWEDGIDFFATEGAQVSFNLLTNGSSLPGTIRIGPNGRSPSEIPFSLISATTSISVSDQPSYIPAQDVGYFLWRDIDDGEWHLRWSGDSLKTYRYEGAIISSIGITSMSPYSFEGNDVVSSIPSGLAFSGFAGAGEDGLDFFVPNGSQIVFDIKINETPQPTMIRIGASGKAPSSNPLSLRSP